MSAEPTPGAVPRTPFIATAPARAALVPLEQGLGARAPFVLLTGEPGTGRSMLAREAVRRRGDRIVPVLLPDPAPEPGELLSTLLKLYGGSAKPGSGAFVIVERLIDTLANVTAGGCVAVVLIDDAERLTDEHVLELHRIADTAAKRQCPLELLLVGTPELPARFDEPALASVRARVSVRATLARFSANDTREYLQLRLNSNGVPCTGMFSRKASRDIHQVSLGVVRAIEALAAESLRRATRAGSGTVSPEHVRAADHALRTGRPSEASDAQPTSQVRAADVPMTTHSRAVPSPPAPRSAPTQPQAPRGRQADRRMRARPAGPVTPIANARAANPAPAPANAPPAPAAGAGDAAAAPNVTSPAQGMPAANTVRASEPAAAPPTRPANTAPVSEPAAAPPPRPAKAVVKTAAPAHDPGSIGEFPGSDDPRVQDWIARFGGRGVRVGAAYPTSRSPQDLEDFGSNRMADADGVVSPPRPMRRQPDAGAAPPAPQPAVQASEQPAVVPAAPVVPPSAPTVAARSEQASQSAPKQKPARPKRRPAPAQAVPAARTPAPAQAPAAARTPADVRLPVHGRSPVHAKTPALTGALVALVVVAGIVAIGIGQRRALGQLASLALAQNGTPAAAPVVVAPAPVSAPEKPAEPTSQYSIAVGSYATRDMASAECDYLSRLVPMRVRVAPGNTDGFRLLLGRFDERAKAELATRRLQDQGLIPDAKVIAVAPLPPGSGTGADPSPPPTRSRRARRGRS